MVIVSHNQTIISEVCEELWEVCPDDTKQVYVFEGTFEDYKQKVIRGLKFDY